MFERFTERARQVVVLAQEEARELRHNYIGTEHILLGLLREEEGMAARVLTSLDVRIERVRLQVVRTVGSGEEVTSGQIPFTPRAKKVLELALREALSLGHNYIGTEHILLGLASENEGVAARILLECDIDADVIRNNVIQFLKGEGPEWQPSWTGLRRARTHGPGQRPGGHPVQELYLRLGSEIPRLGREPDSGDLLVILASLPEGVVERALAELGVEPAALDAALAHARAAAPDSLDQQLKRVRELKDAALDSDHPDEAAQHRAEELRLMRARHVDVFALLRARLGLEGPPSPPSVEIEPDE